MGKKKKKSLVPNDSSTLQPQEKLVAEPSQEEETKERSDSVSSAGSVHSINYVIAPEAREASGILKIPVVGIRLERDVPANESTLLLKIGDERPATSILKGQGRHVSAYVLYREEIINRVNGQDVESIENLLREFITEYIDSTDILEKFNVYLDLHKNKNRIDYDKGTRETIYKAESNTRDFFKGELPTELESSDLPERIQKILVQLRNLQQNWKDVKPKPMDTRNQLKQGNIFFYQIPIIEAMKGILTIFNKMEQGVFEDKRDLSLEERQREGSSQGGKISSMVTKIRGGYADNFENIDTKKMREHLYNTFDYPYAEISKQFDPEINPFDADKHFYQVVRRHIKLFFDTIPKEKMLNFKEEDRKVICKNFFKEVLEKSQWCEPLSIKNRAGKVADKEIENLMPTLYSKLTWDGERFQLKQKFSAQLPETLQLAVTELERQIQAEEEREKLEKKGKGKEIAIEGRASSSQQKITKTL